MDFDKLNKSHIENHGILLSVSHAHSEKRDGSREILSANNPVI